MVLPRTHHYVLAVQMKSASVLSIQAVKERHRPGDVESQSKSTGGVHHDARSSVQKSVQTAARHVLRNGGQLRRLVHTAENRQDVGMREDSQLRKLLVEVPANARGTFANVQDLGNDIVVLPSSPPGFTARCGRDMRVQRQIRHADAFVS